jgi:molybdopterin synthase catalytic subunit
MIGLTDKPIDVQAVLESVRSPAAGAVVLFLGTTRGTTNGRRTDYLEYECYPEMAREKMAELGEDACRRWPLVGSSIVHRFGRLDVGEISVAIAVSAAHRKPAFEAGQWLIDRIKDVVPIWKREHWADGTSQWVHPGLELPGMTRGDDDR